VQLEPPTALAALDFYNHAARSRRRTLHYTLLHPLSSLLVLQPPCPALPQVCSLEGQLGITQDELTQKDAHLELLRQACRTSVVH
jgi:hypothetical protein